MDNFPDSDSPPDPSNLSYDYTVAYEEQLPTHPSNDPERAASLANRIGTTKVYLLSESSASRVKRKHEDENGQGVEGVYGDAEMDEDLSYRSNALFLRGPPISHLPTARIFAYATHFDAHPMGLEWVDDNTCVLVFDSKSAARTAYRYLQKSAAEEEDIDGFVTAKPIPIALWPPEERINKSLGKGQGLKGAIRFRWAKNGDVKKKGARKESEFYKKHGETAGKEVYSEGVRGQAPQKRQRRDTEDEAQQKARLDDDLDAFFAEEDEEVVDPPSPPSKMYSDHIAGDGKTLLERTSAIRAHPETLASRIIAPLPRRERKGAGHRALEDEASKWVHDASDWGSDASSRRRGTRNGDRGRRGRAEEGKGIQRVNRSWTTN